MREKEKVFLINDTDVMKPHGKAFEGMAKVRDASYPRESTSPEDIISLTNLLALSLMPLYLIITVIINPSCYLILHR